MRHRNALASCLLILGLTAGGNTARAIEIAFLGIGDAAGDRLAADSAADAVREKLVEIGGVADERLTRDAMRRARLRDPTLASPEDLAALGSELNVRWLVSATLHDAERRNVPRVTISLRAYDVQTGEQVWMGFTGASGLDRRGMLELGTIEELKDLVPQVIRRLMGDLRAQLGSGFGTGARNVEPGSPIARRVAVVPFGSSTARRSTATAQIVTEAARMVVARRELDLVSPNCTNQVLRRLQAIGWGGVSHDVRQALRDRCGADLLLTGTVEAYDVGGSEFEPEPVVALSVRLLDAKTGTILWMSAAERRGWDRSRFFRLGRVHSRGELTEKMMDKLIMRMLKDKDTWRERERSAG